MQNILISTECVADLPLELVEKYNIGIIYYTVKTESGEFRDTDEVNAANIMEYMMGGKKKALSIIPSVEAYQAFFEENLKNYKEIIHISISSGVSEAWHNAKTASQNLGEDGKRIQVIDSRHLSSGQGLLVMEAVKLREQGTESKLITAFLESVIPRISTSFLAYNADYLYYNDKVSKRVMELCQKLKLHPVLSMVNGKLTVRKVYIGRYENAARKYIRKATARSKDIQKEAAFLTYAGCSHKALETINTEIEKRVKFDSVFEQQASASISCNCGPNTFGILYIRKE